ncbi:MAG: hypothetical protein Aurels2KO_46450 [Aureliella sp.]
MLVTLLRFGDHVAQQQLEARERLAADWQNAGQPLDVTNEQFVAPSDVLALVNKLNLSGWT